LRWSLRAGVMKGKPAAVMSSPVVT
jgi:hypothetical protein